MLTRTQKEEAVASLRQKVTGASSIVAIDYRGLTVEEANDLRTRLRTEGDGKIEYRVVKNTLVKLAAEGTDAEPICQFCQGPTAMALTSDEPSVLAKILVDYAKGNEKFEIKGGIFEGEAVDIETIRQLAALPSKLELRGMLAGTIQAPLRNLAGTLNSLLGNLRNAIEQRQQQLESTG